MKREYPPLYRKSRAEARRCGETKAFKESLQLRGPDQEQTDALTQGGMEMR